MKEIQLGKRKIGEQHPCYIIAELSANHAGSIENAKQIIRMAKECGADCVKFQTYTPDTITIPCEKEWFHLKKGTWEGKNLYQLYEEAYTPWEWQRELKEEAERVGIDWFSTPFDKTAVDFLEELEIPFYKVASFEVVDLPLLEHIAKQKKPIIMSTGMATLEEIQEAVETIYKNGTQELILLRCVSAYPATPEQMNLRTIVDLQNRFEVGVGLSDHSMGSISAVTAVALGARVIEKHVCLSRTIENPDASFSLEPEEFRNFIKEIRTAEKAMGSVDYTLSEKEKENRLLRKSIFVTKEFKKGDIITQEHIRVIRPGYGLEPKFYNQIIGKVAAQDAEYGVPMSWDMIEK